jgi:hypothetical protein
LPEFLRNELGQEEDPELYLRRSVALYRELRRVLRDDGTFWMNIGDTFGNSGGGAGGTLQQTSVGSAIRGKRVGRGQLGIPWRLALAMQADGWKLVMETVWIKLSPMPESQQGWRWERCRIKTKQSRRSEGEKMTLSNSRPFLERDASGNVGGRAEYTDCPGCDKCRPNNGLVLRKGNWRPTRAHEQIFVFAKSDNHFCDGYAVQQQAAQATVMWDRYTRILDDPEEQFASKHDHEYDSGGMANLRSWLTFKGEPNKANHYASYPTGIPALAVKAGTSEKGVCPHCGDPWCRVVKTKTTTPSQGAGYTNESGSNYRDEDVKTLGWRPSCQCPPHQPVPATILDPFLGSGTSLRAAALLYRRGVGIELSPHYIDTIAVPKLQKALQNRGLGMV